MKVTATELRRNFQRCLRHAADGEVVHITYRGKVLARLVAEKDESTEARRRLELVRQQSWAGDVVSPVDIWDVEREDPQ